MTFGPSLVLGAVRALHIRNILKRNRFMDTCKNCQAPIPDDGNGFCVSPDEPHDKCWRAWCGKQSAKRIQDALDAGTPLAPPGVAPQLVLPGETPVKESELE